MLALAPGLVRIPDVSFIRKERFPGGRLTRKPIPPIAPDLAVEVLSESNTRAEIERKLREYFAAGCILAWVLDPKKREMAVYSSPDNSQIKRGAGVIDGGELLPGFTVTVDEIFARADLDFEEDLDTTDGTAD